MVLGIFRITLLVMFGRFLIIFDIFDPGIFIFLFNT